jgi:hypothetical protein
MLSLKKPSYRYKQLLVASLLGEGLAFACALCSVCKPSAGVGKLASKQLSCVKSGV